MKYKPVPWAKTSKIKNGKSAISIPQPCFRVKFKQLCVTQSKTRQTKDIDYPTHELLNCER